MLAGEEGQAAPSLFPEAATARVQEVALQAQPLPGRPGPPGWLWFVYTTWVIYLRGARWAVPGLAGNSRLPEGGAQGPAAEGHCEGGHAHHPREAVPTCPTCPHGPPRAPTGPHRRQGRTGEGHGVPGADVTPALQDYVRCESSAGPVPSALGGLPATTSGGGGEARGLRCMGPAGL